MISEISEIGQMEDAPVLSLGGSVLTLGGMASGALIILVAGALSWFVSRGVRRVRMRAQRSAQPLYLLEHLAGYAILVVGVVTGLSAAGLNLSFLAVFAGAIGIGVGLGLQGVVKEFVSGIFLIFDRMVSVGDYIELEGGTRGVIAEIGLRHAHPDQRQRQRHHSKLLVWPTPEAVKRPAAVHAAYTWAIADALDAAGLEIPFPQTDLRIRRILGHEGDDGLAALGLGARGPAIRGSASPAEAVSPAPTVNDAAADLLTPSTDPTADTER